MGVHDFNSLAAHVGHDLECVVYGEDEGVNVAVECNDCHEVLLDFDREDEQ